MENTKTTKRNFGYSLAEWEAARQKFGQDQMTVDLIGEQSVLTWLKWARRSLQLRGKRHRKSSL